MSKRGPIIVVGIVIVLLLVTPFAIGMVNENAMRRELSEMPAAAIVEASIQDFDRGWFNSTVRLNLGLSREYLAPLAATGDPALAGLAQMQLPVIVEIGHGPVLMNGGFGIGTASVRAYIDPESELATLAQTLLGMPYVLEFRGRSGFTGGFAYEGDIPAADFALPDVSLNWTPVEFSGVMNGGNTTIDAVLENFTLQSPFAGAIVDGLALSSDMTQATPDTLAMGETEFSIARIALNDPLLGAAPVFAADEASIVAMTSPSATAGLVDSAVIYRLGALSIGDDFSLTDATLGMTLRDVDGQAIYDMSQVANSVSAVTDPEQLLDQIMPLFDRLLATNPSLEFSPVEFSMPEGDFAGTAVITMDSAALPGNSMMVFESPEILVLAMSAEIELSASKPLVERIAMLAMADQLPAFGPDGEPLPPEQLEMMAAGQASIMLGMLAGQGLLVDDGDLYRSAIVFRNGQLLANGQPLPFGF